MLSYFGVILKLSIIKSAPVLVIMSPNCCLNMPLSSAASAAMYARGAALWRGATVVAQKAILPATTRLTVSLIPAGAAVYAD